MGGGGTEVFVANGCRNGAGRLYVNAGSGIEAAGIATEESKPTVARGKDECSDGGGKTNVVESSDWDIVLVSVPILTGNTGGIIFVSCESSSLSASPSPSPDEERRVIRFMPAFPTTVGLTGDSRGDLRGGDFFGTRNDAI